MLKELIKKFKEQYLKIKRSVKGFVSNTIALLVFGLGIALLFLPEWLLLIAWQVLGPISFWERFAIMIGYCFIFIPGHLVAFLIALGVVALFYHILGY